LAEDGKLRAKRRSIAVFSISALDLFAAALGAFILIVLVLFPYYKLGGTDVSMEELEEQVRKRRFAAETTRTDSYVDEAGSRQQQCGAMWRDDVICHARLLLDWAAGREAGQGVRGEGKVLPFFQLPPPKV